MVQSQGEGAYSYGWRIYANIQKKNRQPYIYIYVYIYM